MNEIVDFIGVWNAERSVQSLLSAPLSLSDIPAARQAIQTMDGRSRRNMTRALREIADALEQAKTAMALEHRTLQGEIQAGKLQERACLAYHARTRLNQNNQKI